MLLGQPLTERSTVLVIKDSNTLRLLRSTDVLTGADQNNNKLKVPLWVKEKTIVPANHIGVIEVKTNDNYRGDLYIKSDFRRKLKEEYVVLRTVVSVDDNNAALIPVINVSPNDIVFNTRKIFARDHKCEAAMQNCETLKVDATTLPPLPLENIRIGTVTESSKK